MSLFPKLQINPRGKYPPFWQHGLNKQSHIKTSGGQGPRIVEGRGVTSEWALGFLEREKTFCLLIDVNIINILALCLL